MKKHHTVNRITFTESTMVMEVDGRVVEFKIVDISDRLAKASNEERVCFEISPSGYGIHWPLIDEDLSIDGLMGISHHPESSQMTA
jgi:hypothetical protein